MSDYTPVRERRRNFIEQWMVHQSFGSVESTLAAGMRAWDLLNDRILGLEQEEYQADRKRVSEVHDILEEARKK